MEIWVRSGPDFHAGQELEQWLRKRIDIDHAAAVITCLHELRDIGIIGFAARSHVWRREGFEDVWTFQTLGFRLAAGFPGDGRGDTHDFCLIASERIEAAQRRSKETKQAFLEIVRSRLRRGSQVMWTL